MDGILGTHKFDVLGRFATPASHDESEQHPEGGIQSTEQVPTRQGDGMNWPRRRHVKKRLCVPS